MKPKESFIVLGLDPGSQCLGYSLIHVFDGRVSLLRSGVIAFSKKDFFEEKLRFCFDFFVSLIRENEEKYDVYIAIEEQFFSVNIRSAFIVNSFFSIGLLISTFTKKRPICMSPTKIKKIVSGYGLANKEDILSFFSRSFENFSTASGFYDESDAIAIAYAATFYICPPRS